MDPPNYFTCTLGEAAAWNVRHDSPVLAYDTVTGFVDFLAERYGTLWAVGSVSVPLSKEGQKGSTDGSSADGNGKGKGEGEWRAEMLNFGLVKKLSISTATWAKVAIDLPKHDGESSCGKNKDGAKQGHTVAILASSSLVFLILWFGLIRAGFKVLSIEPHCSSEAIKHLLKVSGAIALCHDSKHEQAACDALGDEKFLRKGQRAATTLRGSPAPIQAIPIPWSTIAEIRDPYSRHDVSMPFDNSESRDQAGHIAYYRHSSGTSSGLPKLIPYTHYSAVGVLPRLQHVYSIKSPIIGTLSTTPLYHGGLADLWRAWSAASPLWIFPEDKLPIFGKMLLSWAEAIENACEVSRIEPATRIGYVSCVPYVLQMMMEEGKMRGRLKEMDVVGVGGADMPSKLGDELVADGINLVSRFGNAECGFLLSSNRPFDKDKEWQFLRLSPDVDSIYLKEHGGLNFELIVTEKWPLLSSAVTDKLPFATSDLFLAHPNIKGAWKYVGRSDAQLTLVTGKKFNPSSIEAGVRESNMVQEALVVGEGRPYPALLVFLSSSTAGQSPRELEPHIWDTVQQINKKGVSHAQIGREMIRIFDEGDVARPEKSSKGTIKRSSIATTFREEIDGLYSPSSGDTTTGSLEEKDLSDVLDTVKETVENALPERNISVDAMLFEIGVDSIACVQIRNSLQRLLPPGPNNRLPLNVVYECGTIKALADFIFQKHNSHTRDMPANSLAENDIGKEMGEMARTHVELQPQLLDQILTYVGKQDDTIPLPARSGEVVLLTGGTGFLGVHILDQLRKAPAVAKVILLVRVPSHTPPNLYEAQARSRISQALECHHLQPLEHLDRARDSANINTTVSCLRADLSSPLLGLTTDSLRGVMNTVTRIIHAAWPVNFNLPLKGFTAQMQTITNLHNLIELTRRRRMSEDIQLIFCSSIASIGSAKTEDEELIKECISNNPLHSGSLGYSQSKWVAERIVAQLSAMSGYRAKVLRAGQLCGDTKYGIWNKREAWPLMLDVSLRTFPASIDERSNAILPDLHKASVGPLAWIPVDVAAQAIVEIGLQADTRNGYMSHALGRPKEYPADINEEITTDIVYHIISNASNPTWADVQTCLQNTQYSEPITGIKGPVHVILAQEWLDKLGALEIDHPAKNLLSLWRKNWRGSSSHPARKRYDTSRADEASRTMKEKVGKGISVEDFMRTMSWVLDDGA